jgi:two-component system, chemotaxis family, CheB/CheR fusion protein
MAKKKTIPKDTPKPIPEVEVQAEPPGPLPVQLAAATLAGETGNQPEAGMTEPEPIIEEKLLTIVGIGASAGGQAAFEKFFTHMPADSGLVFVVVQHLDPTHKSILVELLQRYTPMPVFQVQDGMSAEPSCVYVIPPNWDLAVLHGTFHLMERELPHGLRLPIDYFFRSLAQDQAERAIAIILSGTGSDGTLGLQAIKGEGGLVIIQDPASAEYGGMPQSAIDTGLVDYVLPPEQMPEQLLAYLKHPYSQTSEMKFPEDIHAIDWLQKIFILLRQQIGHDFSLYKQKTVARRIERRMALQQLERVEDYYHYLQHNSAEADTLFKELLIGVTNFFRDPAAFTALQKEIIPRLFEQRQPGDPIRVWLPGCATGEEAYSIAILLREQMDALKGEFKVQLFASDIDAAAIEKARLGRYPLSIVADVSPERLQHFFIQGEESYQVGESIRSMVVFAVQSVIKDPPISKVDLISCRNLLIYLEPVSQKKVIQIFHYALNPGGFLFLGNSENTDEFSHFFTVVNRKYKLFQRAATGMAGLRATLGMPALPWSGKEVERVLAAPDKRLSVRESVEKMLLEQSPACVVVNVEGDIVYIHGRMGNYLELVTGEGVSTNVLRLAREGLRAPLASALRKAAASRDTVVYEGVPVKTNGESQAISLTIKPLPGPVAALGLLVVQFQNVATSPKAPAPVMTEGKRVAELEHELQIVREYLQTTIEELEATNEELKSTNEEMQSTNEELESSREELQSVNEELVTLNSEHEQKIVSLIQVNNDLNNVLTRIDVGIIFLDSRLGIRRFNLAATRISNLIESDIGRPISHIVSNLLYEHLLQDVQGVLDGLELKEVEVQSKDGRWYYMRIRPYRTVENVIEGLLLTFSDITEQKEVQAQLSQAQAMAQAARKLAENIVNMVREPLMVLTSDLRVVSANQAFFKNFHISPEQTEGQLIYDLDQRQWDIPQLRELLEEIIPQSTFLENFELDFESPAIGPKRLLLNARQIKQANGQSPLILLTLEESP